MLSVNGRNLEYRGTRGDHGLVRDRLGWPRVDCGQSPAMRFGQGWIASKVLRWGLPKGGSQVKPCDEVLPKGGLRTKSCDGVCSRVDCKQSPAMVFAQGWIASETLQWGFAQGWIARWLRDNCATILNQDRSANERCNGSSGNYKMGTAKGKLQKGKDVDDNRWE